MEKTVLQITPFFRPGIGGIQTHLDDLCEYLRNNDWYTYVYTYQPLALRKRVSRLEIRKNLEVHRITWIPGNWSIIFANYAFIRFLYLVPVLLAGCFWFMLFNHWKIKVIHAHGVHAGFIAVVLKIVFNKRIILSTHAVYGKDASSSKRFMKNSLIPLLLRHFDRILTVSDESTEQLIKQGAQREKIQRYSQWVNQDIFKPYDKEKAKEKLNLNYKKIVLLVGRLVLDKGIKLMVEVAKKLKEIDFVFIGEGLLSQWLEGQESKVSNIHYLGKADNYDLPRYYSAADLVCIPSLSKEGSPRVVLEAISCGVPVVASSKVPFSKAIIEGEMGLSFEPSVKDSISVILHILDNQSRYSKNHFDFSRRKYTEDNARVIIDSYLGK